MTHVSRMRNISVVILVLALLVSGCGQSKATAHPNNSPTQVLSMPTSTAVSTPQALDTQLALNEAASGDVDGLHVESMGMQCQPWIVLTSIQTIYDAGAAAQLKAYVGAAARYYDSITYIDLQQKLPSAPLGAAMVLGSVGNDFDGFYSNLLFDTEPNGQFGCATNLVITNTSAETIQLTGLGVTFNQDSKPNTNTYNLIDYCSLLACQPCPECGSGYGCSSFVLLTLSPGPQGTIQDGHLQSDHPSGTCDQFALAPGQSGTALLEITSASPSQIYRLGIAVDVTTPEGAKRITLPDTFTSNVAFAQKRQFVCYGLQGATMAVEASAPSSCI